MGKRYLLLGSSCLAIAICGQAAAQTAPNQTAPNQQPVQAPKASGSTATAEIIVTASRRSENIREVPTAVSAYSGAKLEAAQIASLSDLAAITPNVQISTYLTNANINIRGIGNGNFIQAGGEPGVAVHEDGVYLGQSALALSTFLDVQRVEILRGPQGTLFGRNATGGAVNIIPNAPTADLSYGVDVSAGFDPSMVRSQGYISGPLNATGTLLGRLSVEQNYNEGFTKNLGPGGPSRLDGNNDGSVRGQVEWRPNDDFHVTVLAEYAKDRDPGPAAFLLGNPTGTPVTFPIATGPITLPAGFPMGDPESRTAYANVGVKDMDSKTLDVVADWNVGSGHLKGTASFNEIYNHVQQDGDGTPIDFTSSSFTNKAQQEFAELLYTSDPTKAFDYVLGANVYDQHLSQNVFVFAEGQSPTFNEGGVVDTLSYAFFAHGEYKFGAAKLFGGLRYTDDHKTMSEFNNFAGSDSRDATFSKVTYEVGVSYDFTHSIAGYAKYATGYKSGGFSVGAISPEFSPETDANYEVGLKGSYLDGKLQANISAFHMDYDNVQVNQVIGASSVVTNAAQATINGVEVESIIRPIEHLRIEADGSWLDAKFDQFLTNDSSRPQLGELNLKGNDLPGAPHFDASVGVYYDIPVSTSSITGSVTPGVRYDWKDRIYFSEFNIPISSQAAVGKLDLFLNYKSEDGHWTAGLFATNVTNEEVKANVVVVSAFLGSLAVAQYQPGREVGASFGYHF